MAAPAVTVSGVRAARIAWPFTAIATIAVLALHVPSFVHRLMDGDEAVYGSIAALVNQGGTLYADGGVDNKPPGIFWVYTLTFDVFGRYQMTAIHAVELAGVVVTCVLLIAIGSTMASLRAGVVAALLYGALTASGNPRLLAANTEVFMAVPLTASFLLLLQRRWFWSALLMVAAGAFKQVAAVEVLLLPVALVALDDMKGSRMRAAVLFAAGLTAGLVAGAALLALGGSLAGFWRWSVVSLLGYASGNWTPANVWSRAQGSLVPFALWGAFAWLAALGFAARWRSLGGAERLAVAWLILSFAGAIAAGHLAWHYFIQVMPPLALLAALMVERALAWNSRRWVAAVAVAGIAVPGAYWFSFNLEADPLTYDWGGPPAQHEEVAAYIAQHTQPGDQVFVWGVWAPLYVESDRLMATRFPGFLSGFPREAGPPPVAWDTAPDVWPLVRSDLERNPPALIVDTSAAGWSDFTYPMSDYPLLGDFVAAHYRAVATIDGVVMYERVSEL